MSRKALLRQPRPNQMWKEPCSFPEGFRRSVIAVQVTEGHRSWWKCRSIRPCQPIATWTGEIARRVR